MTWQDFSIPYEEPLGDNGFWGPKTSLINWCEEDYVITYYCCELMNTLTNFIFVILGYHGLKMCSRYQHPTVFTVAFLGYTAIGIFSFCFHCTLTYWMQLGDELGMIITTLVMLQTTLAYGRSKKTSAFLAVGAAGIFYYITAHYLQTKNPQFHQDSYAVLTATVVFSNMGIMHWKLRPELEKRERLRGPSSDIPSSRAMMKQMWQMVAVGLTTFLAAWLIWNLDNIFCSTLVRWRRQIQLPWAVLLEGHAAWHLGTGLGAYYYIIWRIWIHRCLDGDEDKFELFWPSIFSLPKVVSRQDTQNGDTDKKRD